MKLHKLLIFVFITFEGVFACSPMPGWQPKTTQEQAEMTTFVARGIVSERQPQATLSLQVSTWFSHPEGCGSDVITVSGFRSSAACGVDLPQLGADIIVFLIPQSDGEFILNEIDIHTGAVTATQQNIEAVIEVKGEGVSTEDCPSNGEGGCVNPLTGEGGLSEVQCFAAPCSTSSCPLNPEAICTDNYCGGCNAVWTNEDGSRASCEEPQVTPRPSRNSHCPETKDIDGTQCSEDTNNKTCRYSTQCCDRSRARLMCKCTEGVWRCNDNCATDCGCCDTDADTCDDGADANCCVDGSFACPDENGNDTCPTAENLIAEDEDSELITCFPDPQCQSNVGGCVMTRHECCALYEDGSISGNGFQCLPCLEKKSLDNGNSNVVGGKSEANGSSEFNVLSLFVAVSLMFFVQFV